MKAQTINIAIAAIKHWRHQIVEIEGDKSPRFPNDCSEAIKELTQEIPDGDN